MRGKRLVTLAITVLALGLWGFSPFARVGNVCPKCPAAKLDSIRLTNGFKVAGNVIAANDAFYVIERFGEHRAVTKTEVAQVEWKGKSAPGNLSTGDQILLKNGVVFHGAITEEKAGRYLEIQVGSFKHVVWNSQILSVHKGGTAYTLPVQ